MLRLPPRPVLTWKQIVARAREFEEQYDLAQREFPLDIEEIAEFDLGIEMRFTPGVLEDFGSPAQIGPGEDRPIITVDMNQFWQGSSFYRFSLAHEIGHYVLHRDWLEEVWKLIGSIGNWKQVIASRSEDDYRWMESQADEFASYLLAPETVFEPFFAKQLLLLSDIQDRLQSEDVLPYLANPVGVFFGMSNTAAQARIRKSPQWKEYAEKLDALEDAE